MKIDALVQKNFPKVQSRAEMSAAAQRLSEHGFLVIYKQGSFAGILTSTDVSSGRGLEEGPVLYLGTEISEVLIKMMQSNRWVLPVFDHQQFIGVVTRTHLESWLQERPKKALKTNAKVHAKNKVKSGSKVKSGIKV